MRRVNVVVPAAGLATRLRPLTTGCSKAMVRVNGKPCVDYILERVYSLCDPAQVVIVDGALPDIRQYVARRWPDVKCVQQGQLLGPRHAISVGCEALDDVTLPLVVWLGDSIILDEDLPLGRDFLMTTTVDDHARWCMWDGDHFYDKPTESVPSGVALVGLYSFEDGAQAAYSFSSPGYDISAALSRYGAGRFRNVGAHDWHDIGEASSYFKTCAALLNQKSRAFNSFSYSPDINVLTKTVDPADLDAVNTIRTERNWYANLTEVQKLFTPRVLDWRADNVIDMSYEPGVLLSDLSLYDDVAESTWDYVLGKLVRLLRHRFHYAPYMTGHLSELFRYDAEKMWVEKTSERLETVDFFSAEDYQWLMDAAQTLARTVKPVSAMHGDLHTGNVLYNVQNDHVVLIDPRGKYGDVESTMGDDHYDWCKLAQDLGLGYNHLLAGHAPSATLARVFERLMSSIDVDYGRVMDGGAVLLASAIPMHAEDSSRQERFAEAVRRHISDSRRRRAA